MPVHSLHHLALGRAIRVLRARHDLTKERIARDAGMDSSFLSRIERGELDLTYGCLVRVAAALDLRVGEFLQVVDAEYDQITGEHP